MKRSKGGDCQGRVVPEGGGKPFSAGDQSSMLRWAVKRERHQPRIEQSF